MRPAIQKLIEFSNKPECQHYLDLAMESYFEEFAESHNLNDFEAIEDAVGEAALTNVKPCLFEFFFSNDYMKEGKRWNVIDMFLKKRGALLNERDKAYLRSLRRSHMSVYEVLEVEPDSSLLLRDMIDGGEPVRVHEQLFTRQTSVWDVIGARLCEDGGRTVFGGGVLVLDRDKAGDLVHGIKQLHAAGLAFLKASSKGELAEGGYSLEEHKRLLKVMWAKEIGLFYLESSFEAYNRKIVFQNSDGDPLCFHAMTFSLNADWKGIAAKLKTVDDYCIDEDSRARKFWNWIQLNAAPPVPSKDIEGVHVQTIETTLDGGDFDGPVRVLGTIELRKTKLVAQANSEKRAKKLEKRLKSLLGESLDVPSWKIDKSERILSAKESSKASKAKPLPEPDITPEEKTEILHAALMQHYRGWLTIPVPALGGKTPMALSKTKAGREKLIGSLKGIENSVRRLECESGATSALDLDWLWEELGLTKEKAA